MDGPSKCRKCQVALVTKQTTAVKIVFFTVLQLVIKRFSTVIAVDPQLLLAALPTAIQLKMQGATTIQDIFKEDSALDRALNWCSFQILVKMVNKFGDQKCKQELNGYTTILGQYIRARSKIICTPSQSGTGAAGEIRDIELAVDAEWEEALLQNEGSKRYIASLLGTTPSHLHFTHKIC